MQSFQRKQVNKNILSKYRIDIFRLENKCYVHEFEGDDTFFQALEQELIEKGHFHATVSLDKTETMIQLNYRIVGSVELTCDRSLELFDYPFDVTQRMILKFADHTEELTEELMLLDRHVQQINVAQDIFDFIGLQIPIKKLHPRFQAEEAMEVDFDDDEDDDDILWDEDEEEGFLVYSTHTDSEDEDEEDIEEEEASDEKEEYIDPRWAALKNLKNNSNNN